MDPAGLRVIPRHAACSSRRLVEARILLLVLAIGLIAGCGDDAPGTPPGTDAGHADPDATAAATDGGPPPPVDAGFDPTLVDVAHDRELRGVWVASVWNMNFPSRTGLSADAQRAQIDAILDTMTSLRLNALFFQVRPEGDALYASELEPWSRFLTGTQGGDPGYDPLAYVVDRAHARGIEVHAWFNPYRAKASSTSSAVSPHVTVTMPEHVRRYGSFVWMDPGVQAIQDHTTEVILDVVRRYDIDGVHFDDYFYPYPEPGVDFPDDATYRAYRDAGGTLERGDWRRDNVNRLVERLSNEIAAEKPHVRFGISPFGIYRPGMPEGITGLDQYASIYADPKKWMEEGWLDYIAPQLYWPTTRTAQAYEPLLDWWTSVTDGSHYVFAGNFLNKLGMEAEWTVDEFVTQVDLSRAYRDRGSLGNIFFHIGPFTENRMGVSDALGDGFYRAAPALSPPVAALRDETVAPPVAAIESGEVVLSHDEPSGVRAWVVYREEGSSFVIDRVVPATETRLTLPNGRWAISAAGLSYVESRGRLVEVL